MFDRHDHDRMNRGGTLREALRALPVQSPPHDSFPLLAARARRRQRWRVGVRIAIPTALAAAIALALWLPDRTPQRVPSTVAHTAQAFRAPAASASLSQLQARSQQLQAWIEHLDSGGAPLDGSALARVVTLQDRIGLVDLQLGAAHEARLAVPLWNRRIELLQQLALVRLGAAAGYATASDHPTPTARNAAWTQ